MPKLNRYLEAIKEPGNLLGMTAAVALSCGLLNPLPLICAGIGEVAYLLFVPDTGWYRQRLRERETAAERAALLEHRRRMREEILPKLRPREKERFTRMEAIRQGIEENIRENPTLFTDVLERLDYLMERFLFFAWKEKEFRDYLMTLAEESRSPQSRQTDDKRPENFRKNRRERIEEESAPDKDSLVDPNRDWVEQQVQKIAAGFQTEYQQALAAEAQASDPTTKRLIAKRAELLNKRLEFLSQSGRVLTNLRYQLQLLEDTFGLIQDQIRGRSPEQIMSDLEEVVHVASATTATLDELLPLEEALIQKT